MKTPRPYSRTGLNALKARVKVRGLQAIDRRSAAARGLLAWRKELLADLGGEAAVSAQQMALVELAVRTRLYVDHLDGWLMEQPTLVNSRRRAVLPVLKERQALVDSLVRILGQLGLERKAKPVVDLQTYLTRRYGGGKAKSAQESVQDGQDGSGDEGGQSLQDGPEGAA